MVIDRDGVLRALVSTSALNDEPRSATAEPASHGVRTRALADVAPAPLTAREMAITSEIRPISP